jgi:ADP-ribose pyrophosphatase
MNFKVKKSDILFRGRVFDVKVDQIEYNSGNTGIREVAVHPGGAVVVPVTDENKIVLISQFRYPLQNKLIELPAGRLEEGEDPFNCAMRELQEETGYKANSIIKLGSIFTTPGFCTEELHIYLAGELVHGEYNREEGEFGMEIFEYSFEEAENKIIKGEIKDSKTICGFFLAKNYFKVEKK